MTSLKNNLGLIGVCAALLMTALLIVWARPEPVEGSVSLNSEYHATTTTTGSYLGEVVLQTGVGTLGSVVITGAAAGIINIYDATTSDITKRAASMSTSSILLATFPASAATGTYTFDRVFYNGLYTSILTATPTTTITFR